MATRRHRIVIKPNIRPAAAKSNTTAAKPKTVPLAANSEAPSLPLKEKHAAPQPEDAGDSSEQTENIKGQVLSNSEIVKEQTTTKSNGQLSIQAASNAETKTAVLTKEAKSSGSHGHGDETSFNSEEVTAQDESRKITKSIADSDVNVPSHSTVVDTSACHQGKTSAVDVANEINKTAKDVVDAAERPNSAGNKDQALPPPSETDASCMSEALSLDPEDERRGEIDDEIQKKQRRRRSKKLRTEPLPSREKSPDRQKMKMSDLLSWNPQQNFLPKKNKKKILSKDENQPASPASSTITMDEDKESSNQSASLPAPQVMIGPDGSVVLNTESLLIQTPKDDSLTKEIIEEDDDDRYLNTNSYRKHKKTKLWTEKETERFFMGLSMCGTDFSLLTNLLPHRSRRELKNKFIREERRNRPLVDKALANRQQYDPTPFQKMAAEDEKEKKDIQKKMKKENVAGKKRDQVPKSRRGRKRKNESEDEEDDWGPEYDEEDEENHGDHEEKTEAPVAKRAKKTAGVKKEIEYPNKYRSVDRPIPAQLEEKANVPFVPGTCGNSSQTRPPVPQYEKYQDLDHPRMRGQPAKTYSRFGTENQANQMQPSVSTCVPNTAASNNFGLGIQTIPGSTQVQIEMEGVRNPVQGVLIPSHMVPQIAPQLGIQGNSAGMQVLLVQEETDSGSLVHVYVIPEGDAGHRPSGPASHPALSSPIPSPHPSTPIQSPHPASPFSPSFNHFPAAPVHSPHPGASVRSPSPLYIPPPSAFIQRPHSQNFSSAPVQNLQPQFSGEYVQNPLPSSLTSRTTSSSTAPVLNSLGSPANPNAKPVNHTGFSCPQSQPDRNFSAVRNPQSVNTSINRLVTSQFSQQTQFNHVHFTDISHNVAPAVPAAQSFTSLSQQLSAPGNSQTMVTETGACVTIGTHRISVQADLTSERNVGEYDEDCVILNSNDPQSQLDRAAMSDA